MSPALHLGPMHPHEQALVVVLAFGPLLLLAVTVWVSRRRNGAAGNQHDGGRPVSVGSVHDERAPDRGPAGR